MNKLKNILLAFVVLTTVAFTTVQTTNAQTVRVFAEDTPLVGGELVGIASNTLYSGYYTIYAPSTFMAYNYLAGYESAGFDVMYNPNFGVYGGACYRYGVRIPCYNEFRNANGESFDVNQLLDMLEQLKVIVVPEAQLIEPPDFIKNFKRQ